VKVGVMKVMLHIPMAQSLKEKRRVVRSLKDRLWSHFNVSVAEVGDQDLHQRATIGICFIALDSMAADAKMRKLEDFIERHDGAVVLDIDRELLHES